MSKDSGGAIIVKISKEDYPLVNLCSEIRFKKKNGHFSKWFYVQSIRQAKTGTYYWVLKALNGGDFTFNLYWDSAQGVELKTSFEYNRSHYLISNLFERIEILVSLLSKEQKKTYKQKEKKIDAKYRKNKTVTKQQIIKKLNNDKLIKLKNSLNSGQLVPVKDKKGNVKYETHPAIKNLFTRKKNYNAGKILRTQSQKNLKTAAAAAAAKKKKPKLVNNKSTSDLKQFKYMF